MNTFLRIAMVTLIASGVAMSQNTTITWSALDMGFGWPVSPTTSLTSVVGQSFIGSGQSSTTRIESGFAAGLPPDTTGAAGQGFILYSRAIAGRGTIWMRAVDGSFDTQIDSGSWPRLSHNGRYMLFHRSPTADPSRGDMYFRDLQTGGDTLLFHQSGDYQVCYDWFDDDYHIVFDFSCGMRMINRDGTGMVQLYGVDCYDDAPAARPGSWSFAHHNSFQGIIITDSLGANRHHVPNTPQGSYWTAWSPDGQWISYGQKSPTSDSLLNYYKIHPDGTGLTALTSYVSSDHARFWAGGAWTRDGRYLLVPGTVNNVNGVYAIPTDTSRIVSLVFAATGDSIDFVGSVTGNIDVPTEVRNQSPRQLPTHFRLEQNYPNPFNPSTTIEYELPMNSRVTLKIYNILGQEVATLVDGEEEAGYQSMVWHAQNVSSGIYFSRMTAVSGQTVFTSAKKMILMK